MPHTHHQKRRSDYIESPVRNKRRMDSRKDSAVDESFHSHCDDDVSESSGMLDALFKTGSDIISGIASVFAAPTAPASHTTGRKMSSPKHSKRRPRNVMNGHFPDSPSFAAQVPLPPSPSDPSLPFQHVDYSGWAQTSTSIKRYDSSAETLSQSYSSQNSPTSSRSPRRASSAVQANGVSKSYQPHRKHIRHKQHQRAVQEQKRQELMQLRLNSGQSAAEVKEYVLYAEKISKYDAEDAFSTSRRLSFGVKPSTSQLSSSTTSSRLRDDLELEYRQNMLERAIKRARDALESARTPRKELSLLLAELGDICKPAVPALPESLSPADQTEVAEVLRKRGTVAKFAREQVSDKDLSRLKPAQWLNDEIINFYGALIMARSEEAKGKGKALDAHYFNTFFFAKLEDPGYEKARIGKWTKKIDIFKKDVALIPVNLGNAHWTCAAINFKKKRIEYHDSMGTKRGKVYKYLRDYLNKEHHDKKKTDFDFTGWEDYFDENAPQQENGYDCGVFSCQYMESISRGADFNFSQANMTYLRQRMILEITRGKLWEQQ
ncbi:Smt3-specific protease [Ceratobasidium sp. 392]|nr:Smt3-specific protease [Ceratobasidium sp. 392]